MPIMTVQNPSLFFLGDDVLLDVLTLLSPKDITAFRRVGILFSVLLQKLKCFA